VNQDNQQWLRERYTPAPKRKRSGWNIAAAAIGILVGLLFIVVVVGAIGGSTKPAPKSGGVAGLPVPTAAAVPAAVPPPVVSWAPLPTTEATSGITDGTYEVGAEIAPGKYKSTGGSDCYWARLSGDDETHDIITNHFDDGPTTVVVKPSDKYFKTQGCNGWAQVPG
jgi:hypothetical protein